MTHHQWPSLSSFSMLQEWCKPVRKRIQRCFSAHLSFFLLGFFLAWLNIYDFCLSFLTYFGTLLYYYCVWTDLFLSIYIYEIISLTEGYCYCISKKCIGLLSFCFPTGRILLKHWPYLPQPTPERFHHYSDKILAPVSCEPFSHFRNCEMSREWRTDLHFHTADAYLTSENEIDLLNSCGVLLSHPWIYMEFWCLLVFFNACIVSQ